MSKLVFDAAGKYVRPTRYRQIVDTASSKHLSSSAQSTIFEDQKTQLCRGKSLLSKTTIARSRYKSAQISRKIARLQGIGVRNGRMLKAFRQINVFPRAG